MVHARSIAWHKEPSGRSLFFIYWHTRSKRSFTLVPVTSWLTRRSGHSCPSRRTFLHIYIYTPFFRVVALELDLQEQSQAKLRGHPCHILKSVAVPSNRDISVRNSLQVVQHRACPVTNTKRNSCLSCLSRETTDSVVNASRYRQARHMSIESGQESKSTHPQQSTGTLTKSVCTPQPLMVQPTRFTDMLLNDMSMMGCDVETWLRPPQYASHPPVHYPGPPAMLTRHTSMPGRQASTPYPPLSFGMDVPPLAGRHHSQGYLSPGYHHAPLNVPMPPRPVHLTEMQHLLEISMGNQQPLPYAVASQPVAKAQLVETKVEPIAFAATDRSSKLAIDATEPLAYAVLGNALKPEPVETSHALDSAFDSLDRLLPEMDRDMLFRLPEMDHVAYSAMFATGTTGTSKSPKLVATCKVPECARRVRSRGFCKTHGGGRKCSIDGCKKSSQNGDFCIGHGGGKKCKEDGCAKAAQSHGLCKAHGGGARCKFAACNKSSQGGGLCRAHGGGKRCQAAGCPKGAQRGNFCATHGGFRNCKIEGCVRTDRGGGYCEVHRRGRLCKVKGCKKLSRNQGMCTMHIREDKQGVDESEGGMEVMRL